MFCLDHAGINCFDVTTQRGAFCGVIAQSKRGDWRVFFNMTASKGSARRFATPELAISFIHDRRVRKGWSV